MRSFARVAIVAAAVAAAQPALASAYIDMEMGEIKPEEKMTVAAPQPAQLLVEFQRDAATNPKGTKQITPIITEDIKATGLIGATSETPPPNGARLSVLINAVEDKGLNGKAFAAGFTFGLGSGVVDNIYYTMTISYLPAAGAPPITRTLKRRLVFKYGNIAVPPGLLQAKSLMEGLKTLMRQMIDHGLHDIAHDPAFPGATAVAAATAPATAPSADAPAAAPAAASN
jgi:hypothetical protein